MLFYINNRVRYGLKKNKNKCLINIVIIKFPSNLQHVVIKNEKKSVIGVNCKLFKYIKCNIVESMYIESYSKDIKMNNVSTNHIKKK